MAAIVIDPNDEREKLWQALHISSDRITALEASMQTRNEKMRETITEAIKDAMPTALLTDDEHRWVQSAIEKQNQSIAFRKKVIESSAIWAVPLLILAVLTVFREYAVAHGMWRP